MTEEWEDDAATIAYVNRPKKKRTNPEWSVQVAVRRYIEAVVPGVIVAWVRNEMPFSANNDPMARARYYSKLKVGGLRPGFTDFVVCWPGGVGFMEIKPPGGRLTGEQPEIHQRMTAMNQNIAVVRGIDDAREALRRWNVPVREVA